MAAMKEGRRSWFFSLEFGPEEIGRTFAAIGEEMAAFADLFEFDCSDDICAEHIITRLAAAMAGRASFSQMKQRIRGFSS